jgi:hypothetical protein
MLEADVSRYTDPGELRPFTQRVLRELHALAHVIAEDLIETGVRRIGCEQELVLAEQDWLPAPDNMRILEAIEDPQLTDSCDEAADRPA